MKKSIHIVSLMAGLALSGWGFAEEKPANERLAELVDQGATIDQAAQALVQENPDKAMDVMNAAFGMLNQIPYSDCDDCRCGSGNVAREYPISELEKDLEKKDWVKEVVDRYLQGKEQLMLPLYVTEDQNEEYFYHFKVTAEMLEPYLQSDDSATEEEIKKAMETLKKKGFIEPVRLYLTASDQDAHVFDGRALIEAAKRLGIQEIPLRFSFTDCVLCEGRSESAHYTPDEMRKHASLDWVAKQFFEKSEFVLVDKEFPTGKYPFQYHYEDSVEALLARFSGEPNEEKKKEWMEKIKKGLEAPMDIGLQYWTKNPAFEEDAHAFLAAAKELGMKKVPVRISFQDQITCRSGVKRNSFSALELFPEDRIPLIAERFFRGKRRLILDEIGRHREVASGYPFGKVFAYSAMLQVSELLKYIKPDQMPKQEDIDKRIQELNEKGVIAPIFVTLEKRKSDKPKDGQPIGTEEELIEIEADSILTIVAASQIGSPTKLPARFLYIQNRKRLHDLCADVICQSAAKAGGRGCEKPVCQGPECDDNSPGGVSPH